MPRVETTFTMRRKRAATGTGNQTVCMSPAAMRKTCSSASRSSATKSKTDAVLDGLELGHLRVIALGACHARATSPRPGSWPGHPSSRLARFTELAPRDQRPSTLMLKIPSSASHSTVFQSSAATRSLELRTRTCQLPPYLIPSGTHTNPPNFENTGAWSFDAP